jgi:lipopolysaccharide export system permease protein
VKIIDRYVGGQLLVSFTLAVSVLTLVLVLGNIFKQLLELLIRNDTPLQLILTFLAYILPLSLAYTIPWGFLTSVLLVFGKLSGENELIALRACGVSIPRICLSLGILAAACVATCFWINIDIAPKAEARMGDVLYNIATNNPMAMFGSDRIIDTFPGRRIYVEQANGTKLTNLLVYELNENDEILKVIFAHRGILETDRVNKLLLLHLFDANYEQHETDDPEDLTRVKHGITMEECTFPISLELLREKRGNGIGAMTANELLARLKVEETQEKLKLGLLTEKERIGQLSADKTEISRRFSFSLASFAFALIAVPLAISAHRKETSIGSLLSLIIAITYFSFIVIANARREDPAWHPWLLMWVPNVLCIGLGGWLFLRLSRQ